MTKYFTKTFKKESNEAIISERKKALNQDTKEITTYYLKTERAEYIVQRIIWHCPRKWEFKVYGRVWL